MSRSTAPAALAALLALAPPPAFASTPLEYPDNGSAAFSRGGAWLAVGNEPIATHYAPATLSTQPTALSVEQQLAFPHTCFDRRGPGGSVAGPNDTATPIYEYRRACSRRPGFPNTIPSISVAWRAAPRLGVGMSIVPPATYGTAAGQFPLLAPGFDRTANRLRPLPAPYRYMQLEQRSTILFPTASVGYAVSRSLRVGAGFVAGIGVIHVQTTGVTHLGSDDLRGDHMAQDSLATLRTEDLFVPGAVASVHASLTPELDVAVWGRYLDAIRTSHGSLDVTQQPFDGNGRPNPPCAGAPGADGEVTYAACTANQSVPNRFADAVTRFRYPLPPEARAAVRFHLPRRRARNDELRVRDPLRDDVFDVEVDGTYAANALADVVEVRFRSRNGRGVLETNPLGVPVPPNADRPTGYRDSFGARVGGQWNAVSDVLGVRCGAWYESRSQDPAWLTVAPMGAERFGFGGGLVVRYRYLDVSVGYQRHLSSGLDNGGDGRLRATAALGPNSTPFEPGEDPPGATAATRRTFRTIHAVNGGRVDFDAHVFTLGGVARF